MQSIQPITQLVKRLWKHIGSRRRGQFLLLLILMTISSFFEILSIGAVLPFLGALTAPNRIFQHPAAQIFIQALGIISPNQLLFPLTVMFCLAAVIASALRITLLWVSIRLTFAVGTELSSEIYRRTLYQPYSTHIKRNSSEVVNGISTKVGEVIFYILMPTLNLISASVMLIAILMALIFIIPGITLAAFTGFGLIYALIIRVARNRLKIYSQRIAGESTNVIKSLQEGLGGIRDILIDGSQEVFCNNYRRADHTLRQAQGSNQFISYSPRFGMEAIAMILIATLAYMLSQQSGGVSTAIPMLAAIALGLQRLLPASQQAYGAWSTIHGAQASLQDALGLLDQPLPDYIEHAVVAPISFKKQISLHQVSFRYGPQTSWVLKDIDLNIVKGSRTGFIGTTGSGKSSLLDIIMGLLQPTTGKLEIDGQVITPENYRSWQMHIAHVPQAIYLVDASIEENIAFGIPQDQIDHERVSQAARQAQIADFIESLPQKYQASVGERGVQLSGGQRQRIGIARALYKQVDVIIFDESTSALDDDTELAVMKAIEALSHDLTVLIIAHRLSTLVNCTQIVELNNRGIKNICKLNNE